MTLSSLRLAWRPSLRRHLAVKKAVSLLDSYSWSILAEAGVNEVTPPPTKRSLIQAMDYVERNRAINKLLEMGALKTEYRQFTPQLLQEELEKPAKAVQRYLITEFGMAIMLESGMQMDAFTKENLELVEETMHARED